MRLYSGRAATLLVVVVAGTLTATAPPAAHATQTSRAAGHARVPMGDAGPGTTCVVRDHAGTAVATCHNPSTDVSAVQLHIACLRWWDPAVDSDTVTVGPAQWVTLTGRCWKEIREAWVTRHPATP